MRPNDPEQDPVVRELRERITRPIARSSPPSTSGSSSSASCASTSWPRAGTSSTPAGRSACSLRSRRENPGPLSEAGPARALRRSPRAHQARARASRASSEKSSGFTSSRNFLNSSTTSSSLTSSCSNSIALSSITASAAKMGASGADRQGDRVARARVDLDLGAVDRHGDLRVERVLPELGHRDLDHTRLELGEDVREEVVRHRPGRRGSLELHQDRCCLRMADPDRQELVAVGGLQQDDRLLADHVEADAVDDHLLHGRSPSLIIAVPFFGHPQE